MSWSYEPFIPCRISETPNGNIIHVASVQYQNFFIPNAAQMPRMMLPYQHFPSPSVGPLPPMLPQTPTPVMEPALGAAEMLWRRPIVAVENANNNSTAANSYYFHHRPNEQHISNNSWGGMPSENGSIYEYGQVEIEQVVNRHQRDNREHTEMQQAEAAFHQHFEESQKFAQQHELQVRYRNHAVNKSNYDHENVLTNASDNVNTGNHNNTILSQIPLYPGPLLNTHLTFKLKKAWLQRHVWAEDLKESGVNIDQNSSHTFSQMDDTPPVLQREIIKKRKISKCSADDNTEVISPPVILPSTSSSLYEPSTSSGTGTKRCRKRKISNPTTSSETRSTSDNVRPSEPEKRVPPIKIRKKRGRKPKVVVSIPLEKLKKNNYEVRFSDLFKN